MIKHKRPQKKSFDALFGDLRSLLNKSEWLNKDYGSMWIALFDMSVQDQARYYDEVVPYVLELKDLTDLNHTPPMIKSPWKYYNDQWERCQVREERSAINEGVYSSCVMCSVVLDEHLFCLLGDPCFWESEGPTIHAFIPYINDWTVDLKEKVVMGVDVTEIMEQDCALDEKLEAAKEILTRRLEPAARVLGGLPSHVFYLYGEGHKMNTVITLEPREHDLAPDTQLDSFQCHDEFNQETEGDAPFIEAAMIQRIYSSAGLRRVEFCEQDEQRAIDKLTRAGISNPSRSYHFINHM
jgi:hypothetical protein